MTILPSSRPRFVPVLLAGTLALNLAACTVVPRQSGLASTAENVAASNTEIRTQLYGNAIGFNAGIQRAADQVLAGSDDPTVRRKALEFKIKALSTAQIAVAYDDPLIGLLDMWALSIQLVNYYTIGEGRDDFGDYQAQFVERLSELPPTIERRAANLVRENNIERGSRLVNEWAAAHPITENLSRRPWMIDTLSTFIEAGGLGAAGAMGEMAQQLGNISARLAIYYSQLPTQMRWETQLFLEDIMQDNYDLRQSVDSIVSMSASLGRVVEIAESGSPLVDELLATVRTDIRSLLIEALDSVDVIRLETMSDVERQVAIALAAVQFERIAVLATIDTLTQARIDQTINSVRNLIWLVILLAAILLSAPFALGYIVGRALNRANPTATTA